MQETSTMYNPVFKFGVVAEIDTSSCRVRVCLPDHDNLYTSWLPVLQTKTLRDKYYCLPDIGEHVVLLLDQRAEDGVVLGAVYSQTDQPPPSNNNQHYVRFEDGTEIIYDRVEHALTVKGGIQKIVIEAAAEVVLKAPKLTLDVAQTEFTGNVTVQKKLIYQGGATGSGSTQISGHLSATSLSARTGLTIQGRPFSLHTHLTAQGPSGPPV